jgi:subtilisin-like proprotein convertase family protein
MHRNLALIAYILFLCGTLAAQPIWKDVPAGQSLPEGERFIVPKKYRVVQFDVPAFQAVLAAAPASNGLVGANDDLPVISLPMPDRRKQQFRIAETPVMAPGLQARYPEIRCYTGYGIGDAGQARLKLDITPRGVHGMVMQPEGTYFIDPMVWGNTAYYIVYNKRDYTNIEKTSSWSCELHEPGEAIGETPPAPTQNRSLSMPPMVQLRRYRLAVACTGEYSQFHGGTVPLALAAVNTSMHRVNGVYERDFAVSMQLIENNDEIVFLDGATDPYEDENLLENQITIDSIIGSENYDVGHLFRRGGGGVAFLNSPCNDDIKARGLTGLNQPVGDPFDIDYAAHEFGHQFGGRHTFNHCGENNASITAMEPGSGTTIMAYAGICGSDNVASNSQDIFHGYNITEMGAFITIGNGNTCAEFIESENQPPQVDAGLDHIIPLSTPFALTAKGTDADGDTLTYTWEQMDFGNADSPPLPTTVEGPLFRSYKGGTSPARVFPRLEDLVDNVDADWEELPGVARLMNFRVVARDNSPQVGGVDFDDTVVRVVDNAGPFLVQSPDTLLEWKAGETQMVTWDVANTTAPPVACANVRISLSTDGGFTYPIVLLSTTPNDGSAEVQVPNSISDNCRVKVEGLGNIFFDISNSDFSITPAETPSFLVNLNTNELDVCAAETASFQLDIQALLGFDTLVQVDVSGGPAGMSTTLSSDTVLPGQSVSVTLDNLTSEMAGTYPLTINAAAGAISRTLTLVLTIAPGLPLSVDVISPLDGTTNTTANVTLGWNATYADTHFVEVATNPSFDPSSLIYTAETDTATTSLSGLQPATVYYWRARGANACAERPFEETFAFQTAAVECGFEYSSEDVPVEISPSGIVTVASSLNVPDDQTLFDLNISLSISHTYVGDLAASLISPANDTVVLFDRPGFPASTYGCDQDNVLLSFDQQADGTALELENLCDDSPLALSGAFMPLGDLDSLNGNSALGDWTLSVGDFYAADGGAIENWSLDICYAFDIPALSLLNQDTLYVPTGEMRVVSADQLQLMLSDTSSQGEFVLLSLPEYGSLLKEGMPLAIGSRFTQNDIQQGLIAYQHDGSPNTNDHFRFDALASEGANWLHNASLEIVIVENLMAASSQVQPASCAGGEDGSVRIDVTGGVPPYELGGELFDNTITVEGLAAGDYAFVVTDAAGFTFLIEVEIEAPTELNLNAAFNGDLIVAVAAGGVPPYTFSLNDGPGQSSGVFTDLPPGVYTVMVTDANGCTKVVDLQLTTLKVDPAVAWQLTVSPNPSDGLFTLDFQQAPDQLNIDLMNTAGQRLRSYQFRPAGATFTTTLDLTNLPAASYLLRLTDGEKYGAVWLGVVD